MLALLIQSLYNIADSYFIGRYSVTGLTALSVIYPLQLLMMAFATVTAAAGLILYKKDKKILDSRLNLSHNTTQI